MNFFFFLFSRKGTNTPLSFLISFIRRRKNFCRVVSPRPVFLPRMINVLISLKLDFLDTRFSLFFSKESVDVTAFLTLLTRIYEKWLRPEVLVGRMSRGTSCIFQVLMWKKEAGKDCFYFLSVIQTTLLCVPYLSHAFQSRVLIPAFFSPGHKSYH